MHTMYFANKILNFESNGINMVKWKHLLALLKITSLLQRVVRGVTTDIES